jgi:Zn-dependent oligopeptidase
MIIFFLKLKYLFYLKNLTLEKFFFTIAYPHQVKEITELHNFASEHGFKNKFEQWDLPYWIRKRKQFLYK